MQDTNKALMALVRSLRRSLKHDHGIEVPHAALRASLLQAQGESPHAFGDKVDRLQSLVEEAPRYFHPGYDFDGQKLDWLRRAGAVPSNARLQPDDRSACRLHLVSDGHGILSLLSLDAEGCFVLEPDFELDAGTDASVVAIQGAVPRELFRRLRLAVAQDCKVAGKQLCGDSSDGCWFELRLAAKAWQRLALHALRSNPSAADDVAHWVGLHYRRNFASESKAGQVEWLGRYLESHRAAYAPE